MKDTTRDADRKQQEIFKRLSGSEKVRMAMSLSDNIRDIVLSGLRNRNPSASEEELKAIFIREIHGVEIEKHQIANGCERAV